MMTAKRLPSGPLLPPSTAELHRMWGFIRKYVEDIDDESLVAACRMITYGRRETTGKKAVKK